MRRLCTDYEKEFIQNNSSNIIAGTIEVKDNKMSKNFDNILVPLLCVAGFFLVKYNANKIEIILTFVCIFIFSFVISDITFKFIVLKREKHKIIKYNDLSVNGATVVLINKEEKFIHIMEDDFCDNFGRPYKIVVPINNTKLNVEERLISIMASDGSYFLMRTNSETKNIISYYDWSKIKQSIENNKWSPNLIPHPEALGLDKGFRRMNSEEREEFKERYYYENKKDIIFHKIKLVIISLFAFNLAVDLVYSIVFMENNTLFCFIIASIIGLIVSFVLIKMSDIKLEKKLDLVLYTRKVMIGSWESHRVGKYLVPILTVFFYQDNKIVKKGFEELGLKKGLSYGTILNMYTDGKSNYFIR